MSAQQIGAVMSASAQIVSQTVAHVFPKMLEARDEQSGGLSLEAKAEEFVRSIVGLLMDGDIMRVRCLLADNGSMMLYELDAMAVTGSESQDGTVDVTVKFTVRLTDDCDIPVEALAKRHGIELIK